MNVEIKGLGSLVNKLVSLGADVDGIVDEALHQGAQEIQNSAKRLIKAKNAFDTGRLHGSIEVEKIPDGYSVGTNIKYAPYIEYGTGTKGDPSVAHTARKFWRYRDEQGNWHTSKGMRARPYLRPAFNTHKDYTVTLVRISLKSALVKRINGG